MFQLPAWNKLTVETNYRIGFAHIGRVGSVFLTVSISIERYLNCKYPNEKSVLKSLLVPIPTIFALLYNIPKFFELTSCIEQPNISTNLTNKTDALNFIDHLDDNIILNNSIEFFRENSTNTTSTKITPNMIGANFSLIKLPLIPVKDLFNLQNFAISTDLIKEEELDTCEEGYKPTSLRSNWWYIVLYLCWSKFIFVEFVPWISVIALTICTTRTLKNFQKNRNRLMGSNRTQRAIDEGK